jgi:hypothetical protein
MCHRVNSTLLLKADLFNGLLRLCLATLNGFIFDSSRILGLNRGICVPSTSAEKGSAALEHFGRGLAADMREKKHGQYYNANEREDHMAAHESTKVILVECNQNHETDADGKQEVNRDANDRPSLPRCATSDGRQYGHEKQNKPDTYVAKCPLRKSQLINIY